jgi:hypothetical protein
LRSRGAAAGPSDDGGFEELRLLIESLAVSVRTWPSNSLIRACSRPFSLRSSPTRLRSPVTSARSAAFSAARFTDDTDPFRPLSHSNMPHA